MLGNNKDDDSVSVPLVAVATAGVVLLIITILLLVVVLFLCNRKKSSKVCNFNKKKQHTHNIAGLSQCDHHAKDMLSRKPKIKPISRLEIINGVYVSTKVKSLDSLLQQHNHSRSVSNTADCNVTITPNPSYNVMLNASQPMKEPEQLEYDYSYDDLLASSAASVEVCGNISDSASDDYVNLNYNPSHSLPDDGQDVNLEDNLSYT